MTVFLLQVLEKAEVWESLTQGREDKPEGYVAYCSTTTCALC